MESAVFRIECFCDDKSLAKILWALHEFGAYNVTNLPVKDSKPNGAATGRKMNPDRVRHEQVPAALIAYAKQHNLKEMRAHHMREFAEAIGWSPVSYTHALKIARAKKAVALKPGTKGPTAVWLITPSKVQLPKAEAK